jgi:hypothetical protein
MNKVFMLLYALIVVSACNETPQRIKIDKPQIQVILSVDSAASLLAQHALLYARTKYKNYDSLGLGKAVDGFVLMKVYPKLLPADFKNVQGYQGGYSEQKGRLYFTGNAASNSAVLMPPGWKQLLLNLSQRLGPVNTEEQVKQLLQRLQ